MVIGKYEILDELGKGGFGVVYKARDITLDRIVALKVLHSQLTFDDRFVQYFEREARSLAKIDHPNVVTIHEIGNFEGQVFIAMRYLPGGSLSEKLKQQGPLGQQEAFAIFDQICQGLMAGHKRSVVHRDVKPGNILFDDSGQAIVADFSIAKAVQMSTVVATTGSLGFAGTPSYMPPEMWDEGVVTP
ncbi:MAG TPA: serine/threonine-protein kinase, partial [Cyclobacteriaceae bacterium]|nr:serine/threonine-protein kinase [Cyclobacteriaceae bacterium]